VDSALVDSASNVERTGTVLDLFRFYNSGDAVRQNNAAYMYLARIGSDNDPIGARFVAEWHLRNLHMFAKLTHLIGGEDERILVLYGPRHAFLLRQSVKESPDLCLVDPEEYLSRKANSEAVPAGTPCTER
jgi:hypothetical protein